MAAVTVDNLIPAHVRAARGLVNMKVTELAASHVDLSVDKVRGFENGRAVSARTRQALIDAFASLGIELLNGGRPGARMKAKGV